MTEASRNLSIKSLLPLLRYGLFLLGLYLYVLWIDDHGGLGAASFHLQWLELVFVVYLYAYFYSILRSSRWRTLIAAVPVIIGYLVQDIFFLAYGKVFRIIEVLELPELLQVLPAGYLAMAAGFLLLPLLIFLAGINYSKQRAIISGALPLVVLAGLVVFAPNAYTGFIQKAGNGIVIFSDAKSVESNGRYVMLFYQEAERINALDVTRPFRDRAAYDRAAEVQAAEISRDSNRRNVHLIVLESLLDPTLFRSVRFSNNPVHPEFEKLFGDRLGLSVAPVFGGATAQAEFEILCGIPALEKLSSIEFNVFTGAPVYCLPGLLHKTGYRTLATNAYKPNFFNALPAYRGTGFAEIYFPEEYSATRETYFSAGETGNEDDYMFDGVLFDQNLAFVEQSIEENSSRPIFNYMMAIYGHTPHILDPDKRPEILQLESDYADDHLQRAANQFYYRTGAIASYVNSLIELDRDSLIILMSDHVPPLRNGPNTYRELGYMDNIEQSYYYNRIMIVENGEPVVYDNLRHYDMPDLVLNYLTDGHYCSSNNCAFLAATPAPDRESLLDRYYLLMAHASE